MLNVVSLNVFMRPSICQHAHGDKSVERVSQIASALFQGIDVLCVQELWDKEAKALFLEKAKNAGFIHQVTPGNAMWVQDSGLAIVSKHPIVSSRELLYRNGVQADALASKGALQVHIVLNSKRVSITTTHMQSFYEKRPDPLTERVRTEQVQKLFAWLGEADAHVVCGDFNSQAVDHPPAFTLLKKDSHTCKLTYEGEEEVCTTKDMCAACATQFKDAAKYTDVCLDIDHVLVKNLPKAQCLVIKNDTLSDHRAIKCTVQI